MKTERNEEIYKLFTQGYTLSKLAEMYGMSRQNVSQIVQRQKEKMYMKGEV